MFYLTRLLTIKISLWLRPHKPKNAIIKINLKFSNFFQRNFQLKNIILPINSKKINQIKIKNFFFQFF